MAGGPVINVEVAREATDRILQALRDMGRHDLERSLLIDAKIRYVYMDCEPGVPLCRLRYEGTMDDWRLQMFRWSVERYDTVGALPFFGGGSLEACIGVAVDAAQI